MKTYDRTTAKLNEVLVSTRQWDDYCDQNDIDPHTGEQLYQYTISSDPFGEGPELWREDHNGNTEIWDSNRKLWVHLDFDYEDGVPATRLQILIQFGLQVAR